MFVSESLPFVTEFVEELNRALRTIHPKARLSEVQKRWLRCCLLAIVVTNSVCWKRFERASLGRYRHAALSWMFRKSDMLWKWLLRASVQVILWKYGITEGILVLDDSDKTRSKSTRRIYRAHTLKDKGSGGTINGQSLVLLLLVTPTVTIPVGFEFSMPDPALTAWNKVDTQLKKRGIPKKDRPPKPPHNPVYPTKQELGLRLLEAFQQDFPQMLIKAILADTLYGTDDFLTKASNVFECVQVISQIRKNQKVRFKTQEWHVETYFRKFPGTPQTIQIRGGEAHTVTVGSARLYVCAHKTTRVVIALKYEGEEEYRYLVATDLSWRTLDIVQAYTVRWLVEIYQSYYLYKLVMIKLFRIILFMKRAIRFGVQVLHMFHCRAPQRCSSWCKTEYSRRYQTLLGDNSLSLSACADAELSECAPQHSRPPHFYSVIHQH